MGELSIDVVSDVVCPWCFVGKRRLAQAIEMVRAERPDFVPVVHWLPYFLNPDTPAAGEPYRPFLEKKFGGPAAVDELFERLRGVGRSVGIAFEFEWITLRPNTLLAHRLAHYAQGFDRADVVVDRLFTAYFLEGADIGEPETLVRLAAAGGLDPEGVRRHLASTDGKVLVAGQAARARELGVTAVPTFVFGKTISVTGAAEPGVLANAIRRALDE